MACCPAASGPACGWPTCWTRWACGPRPSGCWPRAPTPPDWRAASRSPRRWTTMRCWAQNGEALRPEQGYPLRLFLPGYEGNTNVKWLRRLKLGDRAVHDAGGNVEIHRSACPTARRASSPSHGSEVGDHLAVRRPSHARAGLYEITGVAWSGRGGSRGLTSRPMAAPAGAMRPCRRRCCRSA